MKYFLSSPDLNESDHQSLKKLFEPNQERHVNQPALEFEGLLDAYYQSKSLLLQSGTSAFHLLAHWFSFEVVFCQNLTFIASIAPFVQKGARPVFLGSGDDWNIDEIFWEDVDRAMESVQGKAAIVLTHLYGNPAKAALSWNFLKQKYGERLILIEDAAEAVGSRINGIPVGTLGDFGVLSFNRNKIITTSGGGALILNGKFESWYFDGFHLATQARDPFPYYHHEKLGYNWRMGDLNAQLGVSQWEQLESKIHKRRSNFHLYIEELSPVFEFQPEAKNAVSNRWLTAIFHPKMNPLSFIKLLNASGVESRMIWKPMHLQPIFKGAKLISHNKETALFQSGVCLPSGSNLSNEVIFQIIQVIKNAELSLFS
jgi:UDP-N-acetylbacillosamine transaminase